MSHMVIFRSSEGKPGYHQAEGIEDAVRFVERLRNSENVEQARIFRMEEVSFEYRPYFRVEVGGSQSVAAPVAQDVVPNAAPLADPSGFQPPELVDEHVAEGEEVGAGARRGLFNR